MTHETLDETIDRVAGELTADPGDPRLTARVRERMHEQRRPWTMPALAAVCVPGVVVIAIMLRPQSERPTPAVAELAATPVKHFAPLLPTISSDWAGTGGAVGRIMLPPNVDVAILARQNLGGETSVAPHNPTAVTAVEGGVESGGPAPLAIAELTIPPVVRPDAVAIAPLDVAPLEVPGLDTNQESKEPRWGPSSPPR